MSKKKKKTFRYCNIRGFLLSKYQFLCIIEIGISDRRRCIDNVVNEIRREVSLALPAFIRLQELIIRAPFTGSVKLKRWTSNSIWRSHQNLQRNRRSNYFHSLSNSCVNFIDYLKVPARPKLVIRNSVQKRNHPNYNNYLRRATVCCVICNK